MSNEVLTKVGNKAEWAAGGGSIPKPLTYDYMPEGYPWKETVLATLLEEQTVTVTGTPLYNPFSVELVPGLSYEVTWDGEIYNVTAATVNGDSYIGNISIMGEGSDTGEPFMIVSASGPVMLVASSSGDHTISVRGETVKYHTMNRMYLPDHMFVVEVDTSTLTANKTHAEIVQAMADGKCIYVLASDTWFTLSAPPLTKNYDAVFKRIANDVNSGFPIIQEIKITPKNYITYSSCSKGIVIESSTEGSTKRFKITVDDSGAISATAVT